MMGSAAYNRGSRLVSKEADERMPLATARADRQAHKDEVARLREQIATLERDLRRARRCLASERAGREALRVRLANVRAKQRMRNDLRRTHATWLRNAGVEPHLIGADLGHTDGRMAERVYGRLKPTELGRLLSERTQVPLGYHDAAPEGVSGTSQTPTKRDKPMKTVPRDRIELSTRGFSIQRSTQDSREKTHKTATEVPPRIQERHPFRGGMVVQ